MALLDMVLQKVKLPPGVEALRGYQVEDIERLAPAKHCGLFLDMGLGKTLISTLIGCYKILTGEFDRVLVLCPETLITQWASVINSMGLEYLEYRGTPKQRAEMGIDKDFTVMSYQIFQRDYERLRSIRAYYIVDEATLLCNINNLFYKMLNGGVIELKTEVVVGKTGLKRPASTKVPYGRINEGCCLLAGIPVVKPEEWYGLIQTISPGIYSSELEFQRLHIKGFDKFNRPEGYLNLDLLKANSSLNTSSRILADYVELPPIIFKTIKYELAPAHMELYKKLMRVKYIETKEGVINALQASSLYNWAQRVILCPEKADYSGQPVGIELLDSLLPQQKHFLIFCKYIDSNTKIMNRYNIGAVFGK